jgi:hypothetical protein
LNNKYFHIREERKEERARKEITSCALITEPKYLGEFLYSTTCEWGTECSDFEKFRGGEKEAI